MKKIVSLLFVFIFALSLCGCNDENTSSDADMSSIIADIAAEEVPEIPVTYGTFSYKEDSALYNKDDPGVSTNEFKHTKKKALIDKETALEYAIDESKILYEQAAVDYDETEKVWRVTFSCTSFDGGTQKVYIDANGVTLLSVTGS